MMQLQHYCLIVIFAPLVGSMIAGLFGKRIGRIGAHSVTILGVATAFVLSVICFKEIVLSGQASINYNFYNWATSAGFNFNVGFLLDSLSTSMMVVVTFVSLLVHIYTIGYMHDDPGYQRFFSYISFFTFAMLMLVTANNFMQLFFGWEGVGVASYLLIGFWFKRESAVQGSLKAFLVNRVGDFGFIIGIGAVLLAFKSIDYASVFAQVPAFIQTKALISVLPGSPWLLIDVMCLGLFVGAMGKSAQVPLHVWLPESMEGPTPISALIHAATMVTAGIFMVSRMSPLYEQSPLALSVIMIIGATGALFLGLLGVVQNDIKRVVAYSTLSQLGYMIAALGASAYAAGMFHLITHACFKALLFLGAGSVIIAMHHEQDMRKMGGLWRYMPITYITFVIGTLALCGIPPFAGFFSKDAIIEAIQLSTTPGAKYAYYCVLAGVFVTALYSFRSLFLTFHTSPRMDAHTKSHLKESPWVVWLPLVVLAVPSLILGWIMIEPILFAQPSMLADSVKVLPEHNVLSHLAEHFHGSFALMLHAVFTLPFWLAIAGTATAYFVYQVKPGLADKVAKASGPIYKVLENKYGFDSFNEKVFVHGSRGLSNLFYKAGDVTVIDNGMVNGSAKLMRTFGGLVRRLQTGMVHHYALLMVIGLAGFMAFFVLSR